MHPKAHHHFIASAAKFSRRPLQEAMGEVKGLNAKVALVICAVLGSMAFFWFANCLALFSLPAVITAVDTNLHIGFGLVHFFPHWLVDVSLIALVGWLAQTYIQLVSLPILQVSNNAQAKLQESHTEIILDRLDAHTQGGIGDILSRIQAMTAEQCSTKTTEDRAQSLSEAFPE